MTKEKKKEVPAVELAQFTEYLRSNDNEDAKRPLIYPLFKKLFKDNFNIESNAKGADIYIAGQLLVESKSDESQWLDGFYQALHYHKKYGLVYPTIMVVAHQFVAIWKLDKLPENAVIFSHTADAQKAPSFIGKENAKKSTKALKQEIRQSAFYWLDSKDLKGDIFAGEARNLLTESYEILKILRNLDSDRLQVNTHNFIEVIERMKPWFENPIDAVHCFYTIVAYWDITSTVSFNESRNEIKVIGFKGKRDSDAVHIEPTYYNDFTKFVENQYVFTNEGSGLTVDYYFSRFDEVLAKIDPEYVKQHGIFFTDANLSKFALWFVKQHLGNTLQENYIVFDPAGGSGNLVSSWRGKLKHKIISELQPDLLRTIERRMRVDPFHVETGFTIIPKTSDNKGLNFLDISAEDYLKRLTSELKIKNIDLDKPLAFLLNPPYKNTDENQDIRDKTEAHYEIDPSILELTGGDAGKERYLAFLGQILNMSKAQSKLHHELKPLVLIFTPTSWLIPRPTYVPFRQIWDRHFIFKSGFIVTSNEFFKLDGKWPLAFTIWQYDETDIERTNEIRVLDLTDFEKKDLNINWNEEEDILNTYVNGIIENKKEVNLSNRGIDVRETLPLIQKNGILIQQPRYNIYRNRTNEEEGIDIISGFALKDPRHHKLKAPFGFTDGPYVGFMDDITPVRLRQDTCNRLTNRPDRIWFYLDNRIQKINLTKTFCGPADNRSYCAYDLASAKSTFSWFAITKAINGKYPIWVNMLDIWAPEIMPELEKYWYSLCFAFVLAENRCVVTKFEANNPVQGVPEVFVDNPMCPINSESFWSTTLDKEVIKSPPAAKELVDAIKELYQTWSLKYCKGQILQHVGLENESYFKYFDYPDFLTPYSGLIQIRKYAEINGHADLHELFGKISQLTKKVKEELWRVLVEESGYFG